MNIIEVVFENVPRSQLSALLSKVSGGQVNESIFPILDKHEVYDCSLVQIDGTEFSLIKPQIHIIKYEGKLDIEISFDFNKHESLSTDKLCGYFASLAQEFQAQQVYGGLEPASDQDTRIFTGTALGPMTLNSFT